MKPKTVPTLAPDIQPHFGTDRPDLTALLAKWAAILKLQDWELTAVYARHWDIREKAVGECTISLRNKIAAIRILDAADYCDRSSPYDSERVLVHELIHLHVEFFGKPANDVADDMREQAVESITRGLIELDRRK